MTASISRAVDLVARASAKFTQLTGYLVITSTGLTTTASLNHDMKMLEVQPGLKPLHFKYVLLEAWCRLDCPGPGTFLDVIFSL